MIPKYVQKILLLMHILLRKISFILQMDNFNFDDNYDSIPKLNKRQKKIFKIIVGVLLLVLIIGMIFG